MKIIKILTFVIILITTVALINQKKIKRLYNVINMFKEDKIAYNFVNMDKIFDTTLVKKSDDTFYFNYDLQDLPEKVFVRGQEIVVDEELKRTRTDGFLIIKNSKIIYESYGEEANEDTKHISWSMAKSFISALFGIAIEEGYIDSIHDPVTKYVPYLRDSAYDGASIKDVLQMSSGAKFNEDYSDFNSDINKLGRIFGLGGSLDKFAKELEKEREPGTYNHYVSVDTQVLGMILVRATGRSISEYMEEKLWKKMGTEQDAFWLVDKNKMEVALGGLNATLRDYARFGYLYLNNGIWNNERVIPESWVKDSTTPLDSHVKWGVRVEDGNSHLGYGYQWWIPIEPEKGEFFALGIYNQSIYINQTRNIVIVKTSSNHKFNDGDLEANKYMSEFIRALALEL